MAFSFLFQQLSNRSTDDNTSGGGSSNNSSGAVFPPGTLPLDKIGMGRRNTINMGSDS